MIVFEGRTFRRQFGLIRLWHSLVWLGVFMIGLAPFGEEESREIFPCTSREESHVNTQQESSCLQARKQVLSRNWINWHQSMGIPFIGHHTYPRTSIHRIYLLQFSWKTIMRYSLCSVLMFKIQRQLKNSSYHEQPAQKWKQAHNWYFNAVC